MPKRTYQPKKRRRVRVHGFRQRMASADGRAVLKRRRLKGRHRLTVKKNNHTKNDRWQWYVEVFNLISIQLDKCVKRRFRLKRTKDFEQVKKLGAVQYHPLMVLGYYMRGTSPTRVAIVASKSVGNAVTRNKVKRLLRACISKKMDRIKEGWDLVFFSRSKIINASYNEICRAVEILLRQVEIWQES